MVTLITYFCVILFAHLAFAKHQIQISAQDPLPVPFNPKPWPPLQSDGTVRNTCILDSRTAGSVNPYYYCPGDWVTIDLIHEDDGTPLQLKRSKVHCQPYVGKGACYAGIWASPVVEDDSTKFQVFPTRIDHETGVYGILLRDSEGRWVVSSTSGPIVYHEKHHRDLLMVNMDQPQNADNSSAMEWELHPTGRQARDFWFRAQRDGCYWQQHQQCFGDDTNADEYRQAFVCGWDEIYKSFDKAAATPNNGIWLSPAAPPSGIVKAPYQQEIVAQGISLDMGKATQRSAPVLSSATIINYAPTVPRTQIAISSTFENSISSHTDWSLGVGMQAGRSWGMGAGGIGITFGVDLTKSTSTGVQTSNSTIQAIELWVYTENNSAQKAMSRVDQMSYTDVPYWYTIKRTWKDGTVMLLNITGKFNVNYYQPSKNCIGYDVDMSLAILKQIPINEPLCILPSILGPH